MIREDDYFCFRRAAFHGHLNVLNEIYEWGSEEERRRMIQCNNYSSFPAATASGYLKTAKQIYSWADEEERLQITDDQSG